MRLFERRNAGKTPHRKTPPKPDMPATQGFYLLLEGYSCGERPGSPRPERAILGLINSCLPAFSLKGRIQFSPQKIHVLGVDGCLQFIVSSVTCQKTVAMRQLIDHDFTLRLHLQDVPLMAGI